MGHGRFGHSITAGFTSSLTFCPNSVVSISSFVGLTYPLCNQLLYHSWGCPLEVTNCKLQASRGLPNLAKTIGCTSRWLNDKKTVYSYIIRAERVLVQY